jgi:hypothetical protein
MGALGMICTKQYEFLCTQTSDATHIDTIKKLIPKAMEEYGYDRKKPALCGFFRQVNTLSPLPELEVFAARSKAESPHKIIIVILHFGCNSVIVPVTLERTHGLQLPAMQRHFVDRCGAGRL